MRITPKSITYLKTLKLSNDNRGYYLSAVYDTKDGDNHYETEIPRIRLPLQLNEPSVSVSYMYGVPDCTVNLGFGELPVDQVNGAFYTEKIICEELTLEEVEKRLGYKVKLVTKK